MLTNANSPRLKPANAVGHHDPRILGGGEPKASRGFFTTLLDRPVLSPLSFPRREAGDEVWLFLAFALAVLPAPVRAATPLTLDAAIAAAYAHNPDLAGSGADSRAAKADIAVADAQTKLRVSANAYATTGSMPNIVMSAPEVAPQSLIAVPSNGYVDQNFTATIPLATGGRLKSLVRGAKASSDAAALANAAMRRQVAADVASAYIEAGLDADLQAVAQGRVDVETEQVRVIGEKVANGKLAQVDQLREEAELADARQALTDAQTKTKLALVALSALIGIEPTADVSLADNLDTLHGRWSASSAERPEIAAAQAAVDSARDALDASKALYAPQVVGFGMVDLNARLQSDSMASAGYTVGITASLPLADGGERHANAAGASAKLDRALANLAAVKNRIATEAATAQLRLAPAQSQVEAARVGLAAAAKAYDLAALRYEAGKSIAAERLDAQYALTRAQANLRQALSAELQARLAVARATGAAID